MTQKVLPEIEASLLTQAQNEFTEKVKKTCGAMVREKYGLKHYRVSLSFTYKSIKRIKKKLTIFSYRSNCRQGL
jgi:hypothetical protein